MLNRALMSSVRPDWNTPPCVLDLVRQVGPIALDPCSNVDSVVCASVEWDRTMDGLAASWSAWAHRGLVYVNPPYGRTIGQWSEKCVTEAMDGAEIIALFPARTDARWFRDAWTADALCFWFGRLRFLGAPSSAPFPSVVAYWGDRAKRFARVFAERGQVVRP